MRWMLANETGSLYLYEIVLKIGTNGVDPPPYTISLVMKQKLHQRLSNNYFYPKAGIGKFFQ